MRVSTSSLPPLDDLGATWITVFVLVVALFLTATLVLEWVPSSRLTLREERVDLARGAGKFFAPRAAVRIPDRKGAWNRLVDEQDHRRLKSRALTRQRSVTLISASVVVGAVFLVAIVHSAGAAYDAAARSGSGAGSATLRGISLTLVGVYGWAFIPVLMAWVVGRARRARAPLSWRLLECDSLLKRLQDPQRQKLLGSEAVCNGRVSVVGARQLLSVIETELINSLAPPPRTPTSRQISWRALDAPRISKLLTAKAVLLDGRRAEVRVNDIFDWLDDVVAELIYHRTPRRKLARVSVREELADADLYAATQRVLRARARDNPALTMTGAVLVLGFGAVMFAYAYPWLRAALDAYPDLGNGLFATGGIVLTALLGVWVPRLFRGDRG